MDLTPSSCTCPRGTYRQLSPDTACSAELTELKHLEKGKDFHGPYHAPSSKVFQWHCENIIKRYRLEDVVERGRVVNIVPVHADSVNSEQWFEVHIRTDSDSMPNDVSTHETSGPRRIWARRVVIAAGSTTIPVWPLWCATNNERSCLRAPARPLRTSELSTYEGLNHVHELFERSANGNQASFQCRTEDHLVIIGGGLTAVQLAVRAAKEGRVNK
eukprot:scaffold8161_cov430-Prasinococcus_capsulatus_cf.AAC.1